MLIKHHFLFAAILAVVFFPFLKWNALLIFATGALLDIDHFLTYIYKFKNFDIKKAYNYFGRIKDASNIYLIFHTIEFSIILAIASYYYRIFLPIFIGQFSHLILDFIGEKFVRDTKRNFTILNLFLKK